MNYLFISPERLKEDTVINDSADNSVIAHVILTVQNSYIRKCVGESLYQELIHQVNAGEVSERNRKLLDNYLKITIKYYVMADLCEESTYRLIGVPAVKSWVSKADLENLKNYYLNHAEWYGKRVTKYLQQNHLDYPLYLEAKQEQTMITIKNLKKKRGSIQNEHFIPGTQINFWETINGKWQIENGGETFHTIAGWFPSGEVFKYCREHFEFPSLQSALDAYNDSLKHINT